ncbi:MAG: radical SAM protein, partial [Pseudomonadota bacterium]
RSLWKRLKFYGTQTGVYQMIYMNRIRKVVSDLEQAFPLSVYIEPTNLCNAHCGTCARNIMTRKKGIMEMGLYRDVVNECAELGVQYVVLQMFGEPFIDPTFLDKARYAKEKGLRTSIFTNGSLLDRDKTEMIVQEGLLDHMVISIDGVNEDEFKKNRSALDFHQIERNVLDLARCRDSAKRSIPSINIHCNHLPGVRYDVSGFLNKWESIADSVSFTPTRDWAGQMPGISTIEKRDKKFPCFLLWHQFYVLWDGSVTFCSIDFDGRHVLGNVRQQSLESLWTGKVMESLREQHLQGKMNDHKLCGNCIYSTHEKTWWWHDPVDLLF